MLYLILFVALLVALPFLVILAGFLATLSKQGPAGVAWRQNIGRALDRVGAACMGWPDKMTICGYVGHRILNGGGFCWRFYAWLIESTPFWGRGHCVETGRSETLTNSGR